MKIRKTSTQIRVCRLEGGEGGISTLLSLLLYFTDKGFGFVCLLPNCVIHQLLTMKIFYFNYYRGGIFQEVCLRSI